MLFVEGRGGAELGEVRPTVDARRGARWAVCATRAGVAAAQRCVLVLGEWLVVVVVARGALCEGRIWAGYTLARAMERLLVCAHGVRVGCTTGLGVCTSPSRLAPLVGSRWIGGAAGGGWHGR